MDKSVEFCWILFKYSLSLLLRVKKILTIALVAFCFWVAPTASAHVILENPNTAETELNVMPFTVYPNPLTSSKLVVNINFASSGADVTFSISNVLGQSVYTHKLSANDYSNGSFSADLSNLSLDKGIYLMKMSSGDKTSVQKLVVK